MLIPNSSLKRNDEWLLENREIITEFLNEKYPDIRSVNMPVEQFWVLDVNDVLNTSTVVFMSDSELSELNYCSPELVIGIGDSIDAFLNEIREELLTYLNNSTSEVMSSESIDSLMRNRKSEIKALFNKKFMLLEQLNLSQRTYGALKRKKIQTLTEVFDYYPDGFGSIANMGSKSIEEIKSVIENQAISVLKEYSGVSTMFPTIVEALGIPDLRKNTLRFIELLDIDIDGMDLSINTYSALKRLGMTNLLKIMSDYPNFNSIFLELKSDAREELINTVAFLIENNNEAFNEYLKGNLDSLFSDEYLENKILRLSFQKESFYGLSFADILAIFENNVSEEKIKKIIGTLIAQGKLEYVDYRCYMVYPSFYDFLQEYNLVEGAEKKKIEIVKQYYEGKTLKEVATEFGVTKERIRQIVNRKINEIRLAYFDKYNLKDFNEDFYKYLYEHYCLSKECWFDYIGIDKKTYNYLKKCYTQGKDEILENVLADENVSASIKVRLIDYIHKNDLVIDGHLFESKRPNIEDYIISTYCKDDTRWDDFVVLYNDVLKRNKVPYSDDVYYSDRIVTSRFNRISESLSCLWKSGKTLRYYPINSMDYTKLFDTIGIANYENTGLSTLKWFNDYPELMKEYDIRDQYELHNLLKKIVPSGSYNNIQFDRQPSIVFGEFDRDAVVYDLMVSNAPISREDLANIVYDLYGYDRGSCAANYFLCIDQYFHDGVYSIDFKSIPAERIENLKNVLVEDFYYLSDLKKIYKSFYPDADLQEINPRSLKVFGFQSFSNYVLKNHPSLTDYFRKMLTREDVFDYQSMRNKFTYVSMFSQTSSELRKNYDLLLFEGGKAISINRLQKAGVTKQNIIDYCKHVKEFVGDDRFFTIQSLRNQGFSDPLEDLGFDDEFYSGILEVCNDFYYVNCSNASVFICGSENAKVQRKDFLLSIIKEYKSISLDDFEDVLTKNYGIRVGVALRIQDCLAETTVYYDSVMMKFYINKNQFYDEL